MKVAISNQKGGVAKTTNTINLAGAAAERGHEVLAVDTDPQGHLTNTLGLRDEYRAEPPTFYDAWLEPDDVDVQDLLVEHPEFDVLPSNLDMFNLEQDLIAAGWRVRERLQMVFEGLPEYDYVFVDAPPSLGPINDNVLLATENIAIPMAANEMSIDALVILLDQIETIENRFDTKISERAVFISDVDYPLDNEQEDTIEWIKDNFESRTPVFEVRNRAAISRALKSGSSIFGYEESCDQEDAYLSAIESLEGQQ
jgi:chromosome partitioning protein